MDSFSLQYLQTASSKSFFYFVDDDEGYAGALRNTRYMEWMLANRPVVANEVLCWLYNIQVRRVGDVYPDSPEAQATLDKWFISPPPSSDIDATTIDLSETEADGHRLAVELFGLPSKFMSRSIALAA